MPEVTFNSNTKASPRWAGDPLGAEDLVPIPAKVVASAFNDALAVKVVVDTAGAAANATSVPVLALSGPIPANTPIYMGGSKKLMLVTVAAAAGAVTLTVQALPTALVSGDTGYFSKYGRKFLPSGTLVGRTYTERDAGTGFGPVASGDDEIYLTAFDVENIQTVNEVALYRHGRVVKENYLPDWTAIAADATILGYLRAQYTCIKGKD